MEFSGAFFNMHEREETPRCMHKHLKETRTGVTGHKSVTMAQELSLLILW